MSINLAPATLPTAQMLAKLDDNLLPAKIMSQVMSTNPASHLKHEVLVGGISNLVFNALIAWLILRGGSNLTWGGEHSFVGDLLATGLLLPFIVALIVIPLQRSKLKKGQLTPISLENGSSIQGFADRFPNSAFKSALLFGLVGMVVFAPLAMLLIWASGVQEFTPTAYSLFKGAWAGVMAGVLVVPMVLVALREPGCLYGRKPA